MYRTNIKAWPNTSAAHVDSMHSRLEEGILEAWEKMMKIRSDRGEGIDSANLSNMFYSYQKTPGTLGHGLRNLTYMDELRDLWKIGLATFGRLATEAAAEALVALCRPVSTGLAPLQL